MAITDIIDAVVSLKRDVVVENVTAEISNGTPVDDILNKGLIKSMDVIGAKFSSGEVFVPEMLMAAKAMQAGLEVLKPRLAGDTATQKGTVIIGTVKGDLHDIGKNLVSMMVEGAGFNVVDLGVDVKIEDLMGALQKEKPDILGLSALLTTTMPEMKKVIEALQAEGMRDQVKVIVGGAPIDRKFAEQIGADGYGEDATQAVRLARKMVAVK